MVKRRPRVVTQKAPLASHKAMQVIVWGWRQALARAIEWADNLYPEGGRLPDLLRRLESDTVAAYEEMERIMVKEHGPQPLMPEEDKYRRRLVGMDKAGQPKYRRVR